jgi:hypothetical protein
MTESRLSASPDWRYPGWGRYNPRTGTISIHTVCIRVHREGHNLDRCRTQFKLVESIERQEEKVSRFVEDTG